MTQIAILIPCYNEEKTIARTVNDFASELPSAQIYVFDNGSSDRTVDCARAAGAQVFFEPRRGKGWVVQNMFSTVVADIYVLVDGDDTYPANRVKSLLQPILSGEADMVVGSRFLDQSSEFRKINLLGNLFFRKCVNWISGASLTDPLSGFRALTHELVVSLPLLQSGFSIEVEITIKTLEQAFRVVEVPAALKDRPEGSFSKIRILGDGWRILRTLLALLRDYQAFRFFGIIGAAFFLASMGAGYFPIAEYFETGQVLRLPLALLAVGFGISGALSFAAGIVLHVIRSQFRELNVMVRRRLRSSSDARRVLEAS